MIRKDNISKDTPFAYWRPVFDDLSSIERHDLIETLCDTIKIPLPKDVNSYDLLTYGYYKSKKYIKAIEYGEIALSLAEDSKAKSAIRFNLSKCYNYANFPEKAEEYLRLNTIENPDDIDSLIDLSVAIYGNNRKDEAENLLRDCLANGNFNNPLDKKVVMFNLGTHELRRGNFKLGMQLLSVGRELRIWGSYTHNFPIPQWTGETRPGSRILVVGEGGIGDEIINARFAKHLRERQMIPSWASNHNLKDVFSTLPFESTQNYTNFTSDISNIKEFDYWTPAMNLPTYLEIDQKELWYGPYLEENKWTEAKWSISHFFQKNDKPKIGVRWSGNPKYEQDLHRTLPLPQVWDILKDLDINCYSLQRDEGSEEVVNCPGMIDLSKSLDRLDDTISVISKLDLVITSCTSVAHIAAALDKPTIIMLPIMSYYTWSEEKETSSWYSNNVRLLRQARPRDWSYPLERLKAYIDYFMIYKKLLTLEH